MGSILGACGRHLATFLDNFFDLGKKLKNHEKRNLRGGVLGPNKEAKLHPRMNPRTKLEDIDRTEDID